MSSTRRRVLKGLLTLAAATALPKGDFASASRSSVDGMELSGLLNLVSSTAGSRRLGAIYLASFPQEHDVRILSGLLIDRLRQAPAPEHGIQRGVRTLQVRAAAVIADDFGREDMVKVEGWLLSRTEARLFALSAIG